MTATNYLDYAGLQRFKTNLDTQYAGIYRTQSQVDSQIDTKLATYSQNYVQIVSDVPTIAGGAVEGIIYLVPDSNAASGTFAYVAYAVESISGTPTVVRIGAGTTVLPTVDQTVIEDSTNAVAGGAVFDELALKVNIADVTGSVTQNDTNPVTSGGVYTELNTNWVAKSDVASTVTDGDTNPVSGDAVHGFVTTELGSYVTTASIASSVTDDDTNVVSGDAVYEFVTGGFVPNTQVSSNAPASGSTDICTSGAVYTALQSYVTTASIASSVTDGDTNAVSGNAVHDAIATAMADIQTISDSDIDALFSSGSGS